MQELDLDKILSVLENPTRRNILQKLVKEVHYPLQLSKELNVSQQAVMKHLKVLEDHGMVESFEEKSDAGGPPRKCYRPTRNFSIRIDFGPHTFRSRLIVYRGMAPVIVDAEDEAPLSSRASEGHPSQEGEMEQSPAGASGVAKGRDVSAGHVAVVAGGGGGPEAGTAVVAASAPADDAEEFQDVLDDLHRIMDVKADQARLSELMALVRRIDERFEDLDKCRGRLLMYREAAMREVNRIIMDLVPSYETRRVLHYFLDVSRPTLASMSEDLDLRQKVLEDIIDQLRRQRLFFGRL